MSAHIVINIVALFGVLPGVFGEKLDYSLYTLYPEFVNLNSTSQRAFRLLDNLEVNGDELVKLEDIDIIFKSLDRNGDRRIVQQELGSYFQYGVPLWARGLYAFLDAEDGNTNGVLRFYGFSSLFNRADTNGDGTIEIGEMMPSFNTIIRQIFEQSCPLAVNVPPYNYNFTN